MKKHILTLLPIVAALVVCTAALISTTFAWFAMNKEVDSNSMKLSVEALPNMVIGVNSSSITEASWTFTDSAAVLRPSQHVGSSAAPSGLRTVTNNGVVSRTTGLANSGATLTFSSAVNNGTKYYTDYIVYIASTDNTFDVTHLNATLSSSTIDGQTFDYLTAHKTESTALQKKYDTLAAASIDFYIGAANEDFDPTADITAKYAGTLNVVGLDAAVNDYTATKTEVDLLPSGGTIPVSPSGFYKIVMRCYVDGGLLSGAGQAFVNSAMVDLSEIALSVHIVADTE